MIKRFTPLEKVADFNLVKNAVWRNVISSGIKRRSSLTGFTLIELVSVIVIVTIVGLLVTPNIINFTKKWELDIDTKIFQNWVRMVRSQAVSAGNTFHIYLPQRNINWYSVKFEVGPYNRTIMLKNSVHITKVEVGNSTVGSYQMNFDPLGNTTMPVKVYFTALVSGVQKTKIVNIATTGRTSVTE